MDTTLLLENGEVIAYAAPGVLAIVGLVIVQIFRRRSDLKKARQAVRLVTYSIAEPRPGAIAVQGVWRAEDGHIDCGGQRVVVEGAPDIQRGTRARWKAGVRTYSLRDRDAVYAIGVMSKRDHDWSLAASPGESGVQLFAAKPRPAPKPLLPWRAPLILAICGAIALGGLYALGTTLVDVPRGCSDGTRARLEISSALPFVRGDALAALARCPK